LASRTVSVLIAASTLALSACSGGGSVTTGSLFGSNPPKPVTDERTERAMHVAATSARATRCGYYFDPAKLRQAYLAYETAQGGPPDQLAKLEKVYDFTRTSLASKIASEEGFCSESKTKEIKADLTRQLAGDFSAPKSKAVVEVPSGWFGTSARPSEPIDREAIFDPLARRNRTVD
jgi:hypothetical protein